MPEKPVIYESNLSGLPQLSPAPRSAARRPQAGDNSDSSSQHPAEAPSALPVGSDVSRDVVQRLIGMLKEH